MGSRQRADAVPRVDLVEQLVQIRLGCSRPVTAAVPRSPERLVCGFPRPLVLPPPDHHHHRLHGGHREVVEPVPKKRVLVVMLHPFAYRRHPASRRPAKLPLDVDPSKVAPVRQHPWRVFGPDLHGLVAPFGHVVGPEVLREKLQDHVPGYSLECGGHDSGAREMWP